MSNHPWKLAGGDFFGGDECELSLERHVGV